QSRCRQRHRAQKEAVEVLTRNLAVEPGLRGITVNAIVPGAAETDMSAANAESYHDPKTVTNAPRRSGHCGEKDRRKSQRMQTKSTCSFSYHTYDCQDVFSRGKVADYHLFCLCILVIDLTTGPGALIWSKYTLFTVARSGYDRLL